MLKEFRSRRVPANPIPRLLDRFTMSVQQLPPSPVIRVTRYDQVSSWLISFVAALGGAVFFLAVLWVSLRPSTHPKAVPVEIVELAGGVEDGAVDETLRVDSPEEAAPDATLADVAAPEAEIQETLDNVMELANEATNQAEKQYEFDTRNAGKSGSAKGTGRRALGLGPGDAGIPREQRWFISFSDHATLSEYAAQLDFFGIELGALTADGKIVYLSKLKSPKPVTRTANRGSDEQRLYMIWQGGSRRKADLQLFSKAGLDVGDTVIFQFYPKETEDLLAKLERSYRNRLTAEIRRTYFAVQPADNGFEFAVTRQIYFK
jgi:hypothetical protein